MKEQIIQIPDTLEIKEIKDGKIILVEKEKKLTYEDVSRELFANITERFIKDGNNCTSSKQAEKLIAINKLMNVAKYLNGDWQPDWNNREEYKYYIAIQKNTIEVHSIAVLICLDVYFKSKELAEQAVEILGEDVIRLAVCTDY